MKSGIVGCGVIAQLHADIISDMDSSELIAVADIDIEKANNFAKDYKKNEVHVYASLEDMVQNEQLDILHICTPHYLHVPMAIYGLEQGIHVFMEKPPAISREQFAMLENVKSDKLLGICFQNRYNDCVKYVQKLLASEESGEITGSRAIVSWNRPKEYYEESDWRGTLDKEGGGTLINQSIHTLDLLVQFLGKYEWAEASISNHHLKDIIEVEDTIEAYIKFEKCPATFYATTAHSGNAPIMIEIECENVTIRNEGNFVYLFYKDGRREEVDFSEASKGKSYYGNGHIRCINEFYENARLGKPATIDLESVKETFSLMMDLYDSARGKE